MAHEMRISDWSSDVCSSDLGISSRAVQLVDLARNDLQPAIPILGFDSERLTPKVSVRPHAHGLRLQCYREIIAWSPHTKKRDRGAKPGPRAGLEAAEGMLSRLAGTEIAVRLMREFRSEEHTSELQSLMRISYAVFCLKKKKAYNEKNVTKQ